MLAALRESAPTLPDCAALFDYDETRLAAGSGSEPLDAFLRVAVDARRFGVRSLPEAEAILAADPATKADVFARLCGLTLLLDEDDSLWRRLPVNHQSLSCLYGEFRRRLEELSLPSAVVMSMFRRDRSIAANGWIDLSRIGGRSVAGEAKSLVTLALRAAEPRRDPDFDALLDASLARLEAHYHEYKLSDLPNAIDFAQICLTALGRAGVEPAGARAIRLGMEAAERQLAQWRDTLPPPLWRYIAIHNGFPYLPGERSEGLIAEMVAMWPEARGALAEQIWGLGDAAARKPEGLPWTLEELLKKRHCHFNGRVNAKPLRDPWQTLLSRPCVFSPEFALTLALRLDWYNWNESETFARSLAAAMPRTPEARLALEALFVRLNIAGRMGGSREIAAIRRAIKLQMTVLEVTAKAKAKVKTEVKAADAAPRSLESRAEEARLAFERAMREAREEKAKGEARLGGVDGPTKIIALAVAAAKLGPVPASFAAALQEIEDHLDRSQRELGLPVGRAPENFNCEARQLEYLGLDSARSAMEIFAPLTAKQREAWLAAEDLALNAPESPAPSAKWRAAAGKLADSPERAAVCEVLLGVAKVPGLLLLPDPYKSMLGLPAAARRALIWQFAHYSDPRVASLLPHLALRALDASGDGRQVNESMGNACLWSLSELAEGAGLPGLALVGARTRYPEARKRVNALLEAVARKAGLTRAELEERIAPRHGFDEAGAARYALVGAAGAFEIRLGARGKAEIVWRDEAGKARKAPPKETKLAGGGALARQTAREIEQDHGAQAKRVERLYRATNALDFARWREFYVEHPFVGLVARRLIWRVGDVAGMWRDGGFEDVTGARHDVAGAKLTLWHPVEADEVEVLAWRDRLAALGIDQPFRQAWRETYRVTDAERATGHYSNRFAGHIVRQHQFIALARLEDWSCRHRMWQNVPNEEPTFVAFPEHGVYAEYWTAGAGGDEPPVAASTAYLYLTTDRVAFHRLNPDASPHRPASTRGERLAADEVSPVAFSEIMRCCDLFVSVASIARDARWLDRGADAEHPDAWRVQADAYWRHVSEVALQANAEIRRELLARLLPALGAGDRLRLDDRRLHVRGARGVYAIHLGSGAAFHASGRHICIVPDGAPKGLVLPYEGDETLALVVSKAMLLLRDDEIADPVILRQL